MGMGYDRMPSLETQKNRFKEDVWKLGDNPVRLHSLLLSRLPIRDS
jgi:hypothetical protein